MYTDPDIFYISFLATVDRDGYTSPFSLYHKDEFVTASNSFLATTSLLQHAINLILIVQFEHFGCLIAINAVTIEHKAQGRALNTLACRVGFKDFGHFGRLFDFEKRFFARLCV